MEVRPWSNVFTRVHVSLKTLGWVYRSLRMLNRQNKEGGERKERFLQTPQLLRHLKPRGDISLAESEAEGGAKLWIG